jgi:hypothetical protein
MLSWCGAELTQTILTLKINVGDKSKYHIRIGTSYNDLEQRNTTSVPAP